ncbi:MAG: hypothetical protein ACOYVK_06935 [Bacillota bacterium]
MDWLIFFIFSWGLFFLIGDWKELKINGWCGIFAGIVALITDYQSILWGKYQIHNKIIDLFGSSLFFTMGPVFIIGALLAQYHPKKRWMIVLNVFVLTILYSAMEWMLVQRGMVEYVHWTLWESIRINAISITMFSWFSIVILNKGLYQ